MPSSHSEIKAGAFVAFCLALLFVMVFAVGDCGRYLRGSHERDVLFSSVTGLQPNSAVNYAGVEIGRVRETRIVDVDDALLKSMPTITVDTLNRLPISFEEIESIKSLKDPAKVDAAARELIGPQGDRRGRKMIVLVLEIQRSEKEFRLREDDTVRLATTVMGDSTVEISPGSGAPLTEGQALLGDGSNLFTQLSDSMREIRTLLAKVSGIIGDEEKVNIKATLANIKKASEDIGLASAKVREVVKDSEKPVKEAIRDLREGMSEARTAIAQVRKTIQEVKPKVVAALESGKKMMESGRKAAESADKLMTDSRPKLLAVLEESATAAKNATSALREVQKLLADTGDSIDENRPSVRRALADLRESARNFKEMSSRIKRQPWLLLRRPKVREQEIVLLEASSRALAAATQDLVVTMEYLKKLADDPEACARLQRDKVEGLLKEIRSIHEELEGRRDDAKEKVERLLRKKGGKYVERDREKADQEK
jgi:ABC-type transporter Mla subunit MlaD